jgi:broad specificity phosphatase PhoE
VTGTCPSITFNAGPHRITATASTSYPSGGCEDVKRGTIVDADGLEANELLTASKVSVESGGPSAAGLLSDVVGGGYVLFFRHSERNAGALATPDLAAADNRGDCVPGSELTANGVADAEALGLRVKRYGMAVQKVYASPTCRTTTMARLAFGEYETTRALTWPGMWIGDEATTLTPLLRQLLATRPDAGKNIVLIAHNDVLRASRTGMDLVLDQAEAAVFRPLGGTSFEYVGRISKAEWLGR